MSENKICVYAICKNESKFVERWLNSVRDADYIVVLDTGSSDDTYEKFKHYAITHEFTKKNNLIVDQKIIDPWRFDTARNISLNMAYNIPDANIFFCVDIDEVLEPGWDKVLKKHWVDGLHQRAIYKFTWSHTDNGAEGRSFWADKIHSRGWTWIYPVHEFLSRTKDKKSGYTKEESIYLFDLLHVDHYPDPTKSRSSYLPLLELRLKENPDDLMTMMYLGHEYYYRGKYEESINMLNKVLLKLPKKGLDTASCYLFIGDCYKKLNNKGEACSAYYTAIDADVKYIEPYLALGHIFLDNKMYEQSMGIVREGLRKAERKYSWLERDKSWSYDPWDILSLASYYAGFKKDSLAYAVKAYSYDENDTRLKNNINQILINSNVNDLL